MNVFITGGSRGIGRATVLKFAEKGWGCAFTYIKNRAEAAETVSLAKKINSELKIKSFQLDIKDPKQVEKVVEKALINFENIHAVVNNAAGFISLAVY
jgi:3-oxoacyl-[acyl-carrier protein] reductase